MRLGSEVLALADFICHACLFILLTGSDFHPSSKVTNQFGAENLTSIMFLSDILTKHQQN